MNRAGSGARWKPGGGEQARAGCPRSSSFAARRLCQLGESPPPALNVPQKRTCPIRNLNGPLNIEVAAPEPCATCRSPARRRSALLGPHHRGHVLNDSSASALRPRARRTESAHALLRRFKLPSYSARLNYAVEPHRTLDILERLRSAFFYYETARRPANQGEETMVARTPCAETSR